MFLLLQLLFPMGMASAEGPAKVAVLPFVMHAPSNLAYLQDGIRDMLSSRIAWEGKVRVIDRNETDLALRGIKGDVSADDALRIGKSLKADHVLFGSITAIGQSVSIDAKMVPVAGAGQPVALATQTRTMDDVIPQINNFAQEINHKIFNRPSEGVQQAQSSEADSLVNRNPELLIPGLVTSSDRISFINPNFIEVTPEASLRQPGIWRSQTFQGAITGMDTGDLDGDGRDELVFTTFDKVMVYSKEANALKPIASFAGSKVDRFLRVAVVDTGANRHAKIFVTNLVKRNTTKPGVSGSVHADPGYQDRVSSFALELVNGKLQKASGSVPFFLNGIELPGRGKVLIGQEKGAPSEGPFKGGIYEMQLRGDQIVPSVPLSLPSRCDVFNFARADINGDNIEEIILVDPSSQLLILTPGGEVLWRGDTVFAATTNAFEGKVEDRRYNHVDMYSIPSPILITDLNNDKIPEIIVTRSLDKSTKFLPDSMKSIDKTEIVSLSWDSMGLIENWKTREISGMVTSIRTADLNKDGTKELTASLVLATDFLKLWDSKSNIFSYDLNISANKTASKQQ
jgi:TolB-like protein